MPYLRYNNTKSGISPRAIPGLPGYLYVSGTEEHDEDVTVVAAEEDVSVHDDSPFGPDESELELAPGATRRRGRPRKRPART